VAQPQLARCTFGECACDIDRTLGLLNDGGCLGQEGLALRCQLDSSAVALQQLKARLTLEAPNLLAQRRLRNEQPLRRSCDVELTSEATK